MSLTGLASRMTRAISSQQTKPPPRSLAHLHHPLLGVMTIIDTRLLFVPEATATTLNVLVGARSACAVSRVCEPWRAQSARNCASWLATCSTGGPNGRRKLSALLGHN